MSKNIVNKEIINEAKKYAGFKELNDPNDKEERYYLSHKCQLYDAFIAGALHQINNNLNK